MPQTRINLGMRIRRPIRPPLATHSVKVVPIRRRDPLAQLVGPLQKVHRQPARDVPRDVAVEQPRARVVRLEGQQQPALGGQHGHVAPDGVGAAQPRQVDGGVEDEALLGGGGDVGGAAEDEEVVALGRVSYEVGEGQR